jgi:hypothetical protein
MKRSLPDSVESAIEANLRDNYIATGQGATRSAIAARAMNAFSSFPVEEMWTKRFCASGRFIDGCMQQHQLSLRMPHPEQRCDVDEGSAQHFLARLEAAHPEYPTNRIFNFDETSWVYDLAPHKVLVEKGTETSSSNPLAEKRRVTQVIVVSRHLASNYPFGLSQRVKRISLIQNSASLPPSRSDTRRMAAQSR